MRHFTCAITLFSSLLLVILALIPSVYAQKYQSWFYWFDSSPDYFLSSLINGPCLGMLDNYHLALETGQGRTTTCYAVQDCILGYFPESKKANYQAASVILGLLVLAGFGPSISEVSLLSTTRPLLSFLISLGAPAVYPSRSFSFDDPKSLLHGRLNKQTVPPQSHKKALLYSAIEYFIVIGAIVNVFHTATILGQRTILSWSCRLDWGPVIWGLIPVWIHGLAAISYNLDVHRATQQTQRVSLAPVTDTRHAKRVPSSNTRDGRAIAIPFAIHQATTKWWQREFIICANHPRGMKTFLKNRDPSKSVIILNCIASLCAFFHRWFGTLIFSSLNFISVYDILNYIYWRYMLSTVICRLVLMFELWSMGEEELEKEEKTSIEYQRQLTSQIAPPTRSYTGMTTIEKIKERKEADASHTLDFS